MSANNAIPGLPNLQVKAPIGATPQASALKAFNDNNNQLANLNKALSGGKHRRHRYSGGRGMITIPQAPANYPNQSVPAINGNGGIIANLASTMTQAHSNAAFDKNAGVKGGARRRTKYLTRRYRGGTTLNWGCYSGGSTFKKSGAKSRKSRKHRKSRK